MIRLVSIVALGLLAISPGASAQDRAVLAIGLEAGRHAFSFTGEADAVNMCGTVDCEVVATFTACLGVAYSSPTQGQNVWTWVEAVTEEDARVGAMNECTAAGAPACEVLNVFCLDGTAIEAALNLDRATRRLIQEWLQVGGFDPGGADGQFGPRTRGAIRQWQAAQGVPPTGYLTSPQIEALEGGDGSQLQASVTGTRVVDLETVTANVADAALVSEPAPDRLEDPTRSSASFRPDSTCSDRRETRQAPCWMEITRLPGCYFWHTTRLPGSTYVDHQVTATWDGECVDGLAEGQGTLTKTFAVYTVSNHTETGRLRGGKAQVRDRQAGLFCSPSPPRSAAAPRLRRRPASLAAVAAARLASR